MRKLVLKKQQHKKINEKTIHNLQDTIGKLLAIDCDSVTNFDSQYKINLFTHTHSQLPLMVLLSIPTPDRATALPGTRGYT